MKKSKLNVFLADNQVFNFAHMYGDHSSAKNIEKSWVNVGNAIRKAIKSNENTSNETSKEENKPNRDSSSSK